MVFYRLGSKMMGKDLVERLDAAFKTVCESENKGKKESRFIYEKDICPISYDLSKGNIDANADFVKLRLKDSSTWNVIMVKIWQSSEYENLDVDCYKTVHNKQYGTYEEILQDKDSLDFTRNFKELLDSTAKALFIAVYGKKMEEEGMAKPGESELDKSVQIY